MKHVENHNKILIWSVLKNLFFTSWHIDWKQSLNMFDVHALLVIRYRNENLIINTDKILDNSR